MWLIGFILFCVGYISHFAAGDTRPERELEIPPGEIVTIGLAGDTMLGRLVNDAVSIRGYRYPWGSMLDVLHSTDLNLINLETTLTRSTRLVPKTFNFKADTDKVQCLLEARIDVCNLANNHIMDFHTEGMLETLTTLEDAGISYVGAGHNIDEARRPLIILKKGLTIGIIGCTDNEPNWEAGRNRSGTFYVNVNTPEELEAEVKHIRNRVDFLILTIHWGPNMRTRPNQTFISFAHRMIDAGVDILHGHSAHIFQGIEIYKDKLILYDTGDFVDDYYVTPSLRNDLSFFYMVQVDWAGIIRLDLIPVIISNMQVNHAVDKEYKHTVLRLKKLSKEFGTVIFEEDGKVWVPVRD